MQSQSHIAGLWSDILCMALGSDPSSRIAAFPVNERSHPQRQILARRTLTCLHCVQVLTDRFLALSSAFDDMASFAPEAKDTITTTQVCKCTACKYFSEAA
jgi:hypothetical protein